MPATIPAHVALRSRLRDSVTHALGLNERLEAAIGSKTQRPSGVFHGKVDFSQPPWNAPVAMAVMELHAIARDVEATLRLALKLPSRMRGGSSHNTVQSLDAVMRLCDGADDSRVRETIRELERWSRRARIALGAEEPLKRIPRLPGEKEPACPWCELHSLRMKPMEGQIRCITPGCTDEQGRKPEARMEFSRHVGDFVLVWQDQKDVQ